MVTNNVIGIDIKRRLQDITDIKEESGKSVERSLQAKVNADESVHRSDITKKQLEEALKDGDQVVEVQTTRVDPVDGKVYATASDRLEANQREVSSLLADIGDNVRKSGAFGTGLVNDTAALQKALNNKGNILFANGTFLVDPEVGLDVLDDTIITFKNAKIISMATGLESYEMIRIHGRKNVEIFHPIIVGDRKTHTGTTGEWGHGLSIRGSKNITVHNLDASECWGDGIYLGTLNGVVNEDVKILGVTKTASCRRQGVSVISGIDCYIEDLRAEDIDGTAPMAAIDFEPNDVNDVIRNFNVGSVTAVRCTYALIFVPRRRGSLDIKIKTVNVIDCIQPVRFAQHEDGMHLDHGSIVIDNILIDKVEGNVNPILINNWFVDYSPNILVKNLTVNEFNGTGFPAMIQFIASIETPLTNRFGGFTFENIVLNKTNSSVDVYPLHIRRLVPLTNVIENVNAVNFVANTKKGSPYSFADFTHIVNSRLSTVDDKLKAGRNDDLTKVIEDMSLNEIKTVHYDSGRSGLVGYPKDGRGNLLISKHSTHAMMLVFNEASNTIYNYRYNLSTKTFDVISTVYQSGRMLQGTTADRPNIGISTGAMYFDTSLKKPIWRSGSVWVDATGATV